MDEDDIEDFVEEVVEEVDIGDTKLDRWLIKKAINVFTNGLTKKEKVEYDGQAAREAEDRRARASMKEQREQTIFEMRKEKETLAIQKLQTEIEQLKTGQIIQFQPGSSEQQPQVLYGELPSVPQAPNLQCETNPEEFTTWLEYISVHPSHVVILGSTGQGKSALGHALLEYLHSITGRNAILFAPMSIPRRLLPSWIRIIDDWDSIPDNALVLVDEAAIMLNSRNPGARANRDFGEINAISRQKNLCLIFVSQSSGSLDINALRVGAVEVIYKKPPTFAGIGERKEIKDMAKLTKTLLGKVDQQHIKEYSVIFPSNTDVMVMRSGLSSYWNEEVSTMYKHCVGTGAIDTASQVQAESSSKKDEILRLSSQGLTHQEIADKLSVSRPYVSMVVGGKK